MGKSKRKSVVINNGNDNGGCAPGRSDSRTRRVTSLRTSTWPSTSPYNISSTNSGRKKQIPAEDGKQKEAEGATNKEGSGDGLSGHDDSLLGNQINIDPCSLPMPMTTVSNNFCYGQTDCQQPMVSDLGTSNPISPYHHSSLESVHYMIGAYVPQPIKEKIIRGEYLEQSTLLKSNDSNARVFSISPEGQLIAKKTKCDKINYN
ncbi:hypothetical protein LOTGIDRAFT_157344 [Lottia gigantea]|uniref:Uncharacterized protein n=1 Tax=Lottia gigantea TaxID=225164 RepID=V4B430_LOTGI|nr:hypothetical protein LOTGIDRAFT_157344 [Lottia gigantea]ESP02186.1 hypothetical protein LOTGIDRAFT_157344 [Lottia gigantea]